MILIRAFRLIVAAALACVPFPVGAQAYPSKPVKIVVPTQALDDLRNRSERDHEAAFNGKVRGYYRLVRSASLVEGL